MNPVFFSTDLIHNLQEKQEENDINEIVGSMGVEVENLSSAVG